MSIKVALPFDPKWDAVVWAEENCPSYITNTVSYDDRAIKPQPWSGPIHRAEIIYHFGDEQDAVLFALRWR